MVLQSLGAVRWEAARGLFEVDGQMDWARALPVLLAESCVNEAVGDATWWEARLADPAWSDAAHPSPRSWKRDTPKGTGRDALWLVDDGIGPVGFYGRCSTEDNQDPETSRAWQLGNARKFVEPLGASVVAEFFDIGQSRSVPWERRDAAGRLLAALKDRDRGWNALVVGEGTLCWLGNQFSLVAPKFAAYGVDLWVPELGGRFDARNPSHKMLMSVLGGMSESERQHVQARVRAAMDAQVLNEGRHQGGRAPYGYLGRRAAPEPTQGSGGLPAAGARSRRTHGRGRAPDLRPVSRRQWRPRDCQRTEPGRHPVSLGSAAGPEPASAGGWLAGQHGSLDLGESPVHGLRILRPLDQARNVAALLVDVVRQRASSGGPGTGRMALGAGRTGHQRSVDGSDRQVTRGRYAVARSGSGSSRPTTPPTKARAAGPSAACTVRNSS